MKRKLKLLGIALGVTVLLALSLGGVVMAADGWDRGANCGDCLEGSDLAGIDCPRLNSDGSAELDCPRWSEDADRPCLEEDGVCSESGCAYANEGELTGAGNCWQGEQTERPCFGAAGEDVTAGVGYGCMRGGR